jgi:hypothetical protein
LNSKKTKIFFWIFHNLWNFQLDRKNQMNHCKDCIMYWV